MTYTVNQLEKMGSISPRTFHYYDELGLLEATALRIDDYRVYDAQAIEKMWGFYSFWPWRGETQLLLNQKIAGLSAIFLIIRVQY